MIEFDDQNWPLAIVLIEDAMSLADHRSLLEQLCCWLDREHPFVLLCLFVSEASAAQPAGAVPETERWLRAHGARIRSLVPGIAASVLNGWSGEPVREDFFGALSLPTRLFDNGIDAVAWLRNEILAPAGMRIDDL